MKGENNSSKIKDQDISDDLHNWSKLKNSKSRGPVGSLKMMYLMLSWATVSVLDVDQHSTGFLKHVENKVKPLAGKTKSQKRKIHYLEGVTAEKTDPCSKKTWALNVKLQEFLSPMHPLLMSLRTYGSLVNNLTELILKWEGQETVWIEITNTKLWRTLTSLQRSQITGMSDF